MVFQINTIAPAARASTINRQLFAKRQANICRLMAFNFCELRKNGLNL